MKKFISYLKGVKSELSHVRWSKKEEVIKDFAAVVSMSLILIAFFVISDFIVVGIKDFLLK